MEITMNSVLDKDLSKHEESKPSTSELITIAAGESGVNPFKTFLDYLKIKKGVGRLRFDEYVSYGMHMPEKWKEGERERFLSTHIHWNIYNEVSTTDWWAVTEDKWVSALFLESAQVPVPTTVGVIDKSKRLYPGTLKLDSAESLAALLKSNPETPLFAKAQNGVASDGAFVIEGGDQHQIFVRNENPMTYDYFLNSYVGNTNYILQEIVNSHPFFDGVTNATPTVRLINLTNDDGVFTPYAVLKLPRGQNIADNFWREGNLVCSLDIETGQIETIVSKDDYRYVNHESLPNSDRMFIGETFPYWKEICALNEKVALMHSQIAFSSTDIAVTDAGPIVIEVNSGSAFELPQIANGKGFLSDGVREFFIAAGSKLVN